MRTNTTSKHLAVRHERRGRQGTKACLADGLCHLGVAQLRISFDWEQQGASLGHRPPRDPHAQRELLARLLHG